MSIFFISAIIGIAIGFVLAFAPFGNYIFTFLIAITAIFIAMYIMLSRFRESEKGTKLFIIFVFAWIVTGIYHFAPKGTYSYIPRMELENVKVRYFIEVIRDIHPNIEFRCSDEILDRQMDLNTITSITVRDAIKILNKRVGTEHSYKKIYKGSSIARGPKVIVTLTPESSILEQSGKLHDEDGKPFFYDAY